MKFVIHRVSHWGCKPCEEAKLEKLTGFMDCACKTIDEALKHKWVREGIPEQRDGYVRVFTKEKRDVWVVEFDTLEQLLKFYEKYGDMVITQSYYKEAPIAIEIYDDFRE